MTPNAELLDDLLAPTRIYVASVQAALKHHADAIHGMVHITGGGFQENIPRVFTNKEHAALIEMDSWAWPDVFAWMQQAGNIETEEMMRTFNCGIGFVLIVKADEADAVMATLSAADEAPLKIGTVVTSDTEPTSSQLLARA